MRVGIYIVVSIVYLSFSWCFANEDLSLLTKQIAWAAANIENDGVTSAFRKSFTETLQQSKNSKTLQSAEGQKLLQRGQGVLRVIDLKEKLKKCYVSETASADIQNALMVALDEKAKSSDFSYIDPCQEFRQPSSSNRRTLQLGKQIEEQYKAESQKKVLAIANSQVNQTREYWKQVGSQNHTEIALELMDREFELQGQPPRGGVELLLYTDTIKNRKKNSAITKTHVAGALKEVSQELDKHQKYLNDLGTQKPDEALQSLLVSNPAAMAQFLLENPDSFDTICKTLQDYDSTASRKALTDKVVFWGGLAVAGVLLAVTGVGAIVALSGAVAGNTLLAVGAGAAIAGTAVGGGEMLYSSNKAHDSYIEAQTLRSASFSEGSSNSFRRADASLDKAYDDLQEAGFAAVGIIPFGAGIKVMKNAAAASRLGSASRVAAEGATVEKAAVEGLSTSLKEIASDKEALTVLKKVESEVSQEEMGTFLGYFSTLNETEKAHVLKLIKEKPDRVAKSIRNSSESGVCR